jgi:hypothetical protein
MIVDGFGGLEASEPATVPQRAFGSNPIWD